MLPLIRSFKGAFGYFKLCILPRKTPNVCSSFLDMLRTSDLLR